MAIVRGFAFPDDLHYLMEQDTWARFDADGLVTVGLTSLGAHISGEFFAFMPKRLGTEIERDRAFGMLEMSKVVRSAHAPVSGTIIAINAEARTHPTLVNQDPYGRGWLVRLKPSAWQTDSAMLVSGQSIADAAIRYMYLNLVLQFGEEPPAA
ncbi:MAG TPA: glycine cleavage system protein H [Burkholderiales bacterium]|nr:glycine cleavage system protein H [Burkholderiales bacterium]